uniref:Aminopeptidase N-like N-terminal domain-containing protein n=1 Tax=Aceria tosichella TaxID=561515 RepID=A0A6G1SPM5_9ACAR
MQLITISKRGFAITIAYCALVAITGCLSSEFDNLEPFDNDNPISVPFSDGLPTHVKPSSYMIHLSLVDAIAQAADSKDSSIYYTGSVGIDVGFHDPAQDKNPTFGCRIRSWCKNNERLLKKWIVMHADESVEITGVKVVRRENNQGYNRYINIGIANTGRDRAKQMIVIELKQDPSELLSRRARILINFRAPIRRNELHGLYLRSDKSNEQLNTHHIMANFQPSSARLAVPCFDEPSFEAPLELFVQKDKSKGGLRLNKKMDRQSAKHSKDSDNNHGETYSLPIDEDPSWYLDSPSAAPIELFVWPERAD